MPTTAGNTFDSSVPGCLASCWKRGGGGGDTFKEGERSGWCSSISTFSARRKKEKVQVQ